VLINRNYTRLWAAQAISVLGDYVFETTLLLWIASVLLAGSSSAPAAVSGVLIAFALATILVSPVAGVFVDRWDKRRTMMATDLIRAAVVGILTVLAFLPEGTLGTPLTLALIYVFVFLNNAVARFFMPARFTLLSDIVTGDADRAKASGIAQATEATAMIIGPPLAAPLLFTVGLQWALLLNALSFAGSFLFVRFIKPPAPQDQPASEAPAATPGFWAQLREGAGYAVRSRQLVTLLIAAVIVTVSSGAVNTLDVFFVTENLGTDLKYYGFLGAALGVGVILGALGSGWVSRRIGVSGAFNAGLVGAGVVFVAYTRMTALGGALVLLALLGAALGVVNSMTGPLMMNAVPRHVLGRVTSLFNPVQQVASILGALVAGSIAASLAGLRLTAGPVTFQRIDLILGVAAMLFIAGGIYSAVMLRASAPAAEPAAEPVTAEM
jgi:MFS family permease